MIPSPFSPTGRRTPAVYVDGSVLAQYLPDAPHHDAWLAWARGRRVVTSQVGLTELHGVAFARGGAASAATRAAVDEAEAQVEVLRFSDKALQVASHVSTALPSFVALHVGTAVSHVDVETVATYDVGLARVAALYGLAVVSPGWPDRWWENAS